MIITKISGGLGNQMFQYATGRAASLRTNTVLKLDIGSYADDKFGRHYSLDIFNIRAKLATPLEINKLKPSGNFLVNESPRLHRMVARLTKTYVNEEFRKGEIPWNVHHLYLDGYWQSEKYFANYSRQIHDDFKVKLHPSSRMTSYLEKIKSSNSVAIHIRRGDYVKIARIKQAVGVCGVNYYQRAIRFISEQVNNPVFYIFSEPDGLKWTKTRLKIKYPIVYVNGKDYEDLQLMSSCKHVITANSSFSWWGAWLNRNPKKIVIAPSPWFTWFKVSVSDYHSAVPVGWIEFPKG